MRGIAVLTVVCALGSSSLAEESRPDVYVPYEDLARLIEPADRAVLMDRAEFEALLAAAETNARDSGTIELGQVLQATYRAEIEEDKLARSTAGRLTLTGTLDVVSLGKGPVAVPLVFGQVGLTRMLLDGKSAPLGYDPQGRLTLIVATNGSHRLDVAGTARLTELPTGGTQFGMSLPAAAAGNMTLIVPGDLEIHASVPITQSQYDKQTDRTSAELTLGGQDKLTVVLLGNGRQQDQDAILLGESATTVSVTPSDQQLQCLYTLQVLRRGAREVQLQLPPEWTVTEVTCPNLVRWSIEPPKEPGALQVLAIRLRSEEIGTTTILIKAHAPCKRDGWRAPRLILSGAAYERGYVLVNTDEGLSVRAEQLTDARREDVRSAGGRESRISSLELVSAAAGGRLYFHWGRDWLVQLELATVELRRSIKERQGVCVSPQRVTLTANFEVTAIGRELFQMSFVLGGPAELWEIMKVQVDRPGASDATAFEYRVQEPGLASPSARLLTIELAAPIRPEKVANVTIELEHVPADWYWPADAAQRIVPVPLVHHQVSQGGDAEAPALSGEVLISALEDLDAVAQTVPETLKAVPVGRMASLGIGSSVQYAYSYNTPVTDQIQLQVSRRRPRISADAVGLVTVGPRQFTSSWRIVYAISRASTKRLYLLADKSLGREIKIASPTVATSSWNIVTPEAKTVSLPAELARRYDLWLLDLDHKALGEVVVDVHYERPKSSDDFDIPLVRPVWEQSADSNAPAQGQTSEHLAIQASEELALTVSATGAKEMDAVDLPPLPAEAGRVVAAFRLDAPTTQTGSAAAIHAKTAVHERYEIPSALALSAELTTYLDVKGGQRTQAQFSIANAGKQFLTIRLPEGAQLWSLRVRDEQAKPQSVPGRTGTDYQVALGPLGKPVDVKIVYAIQPGRGNLERLRLGGVELPGVEINQMSWTVIPPPGYCITTQETKMQSFGLTKLAPACTRLFDLLLSSPTLMRRVSPASYRTGGGAQYHDEKEMGVMYEYEAGLQQTPPLAAPPIAGYGGMAPVAAAPLPGEPVQAQPAPQPARSVKLAHEGRTTLPVDLVPTPGAGPQVRFTALGPAELAIGLTSQSRQGSWWILGFTLIAAAGAILARKPARVKSMLIIAVLSASSLSALWLPATTSFANGAFTAGVCLVLLYALIRLATRIWSRLFAGAAPSPAAVATVLLLALSFGPSAKAADAHFTAEHAETAEKSPISKSSTLLAASAVNALPAVIPYSGDPSAAEQANRTLVPYARFVELWNQAHPDDRIDWPEAETQISLADVQYKVTIGAEQLDLVLTAEVQTHGSIPENGERRTEDGHFRPLSSGLRPLALPMSSLAVTGATFNGKPASVTAAGQAEPKRMVLMLPGDTSGRLELHAVAKPEYVGRRGSISFTLPPLPAAVMTVVLHEADLELEVDEIEIPGRGTPLGAVPEQRVIGGTVQYTFGLGTVRKLALRWQPKIAASTMDRTLSADSRHDIYAFHWALVGVSKVTYSFSGGQYDLFTLLMPQGATLTELEGTNIRNFRDIGEQIVEGSTFRVIEVRLARPAQKQYEMTARWLSPLACGGGLDTENSTELPLPRAGAVSRESGTVSLYAAGGMNVKVTSVTGGRRVNNPRDDAPRTRGEQSDAAGAALTADRAGVVATYYWPYRPFALRVELSRPTVTPKVHLDQLVRIDADRVELLVQAGLKSEEGSPSQGTAGRLFGASFYLPAGYDLLSAVGPAVASFYERSGQEGRLLHVMFHQAQSETQVALMLVRKDAPLDSAPDGQPVRQFRADIEGMTEQAGFDVPLVRATVPPEQGRIAVQVAASLEAQTAASANIKSVPPATLRDWLDEKTVSSVQFACQYEAANPSLRLTIRRLPTTIRAEVFAGLVVRPAAADYTYRLRYNITGSPVDHLSFRLPSEYARLVSVESKAMRSVTQSDAGGGLTRWTVALMSEVTGFVDIAVNFALPIEPASTALAIPALGVEGAAEYRAVVAVQNMSRHEISVKDSAQLSDLAASEQQRLMPAKMRESLQYVLQSFEQDWSLNLELTQTREGSLLPGQQAAARIQAVVDLLEVTTVIDRSGRCRYQVRVALQNRSEQFLRVRLPAGLHLWSASVAGQPVKPVVSAIHFTAEHAEPAEKKPISRSSTLLAASAVNALQADVLIPLVKTSPGGLPYDVRFYLADDGAGHQTPVLGLESCVLGLSLTRLEPPSISIVGIPVAQTTWSLRLPGGYRYMRPGGNMSPVAGAVEVLSLGIEAKLEQLKRLERTYRDVAGSSARTEQIARSNWEAFNKDLSEEIGQVQSYLASRRSQVGEQDYKRLETKLDAQRQQQAGLLASNTLFVERQQSAEGSLLPGEQVRQDLNAFLNFDASNVGVSEIVRNQALLDEPEFLSRNQEQQIVRLQQELASLSPPPPLPQAASPTAPADAEKASTQQTVTINGTKAEDRFGREFTAEGLLGKSADKDLDMSQAMQQLGRETAAQISRKQAQIKGQLEELKDNRLQRHFQAGTGKPVGPAIAGQAPPSAVQSIAAPPIELPAQSREVRLGTAGAGSLLLGSQLFPAIRGPMDVTDQPQGQTAAAGSGPQAAAEQVRGRGLGVNQAYAPQSAFAGVQVYTAGGTYSLPVTLPGSDAGGPLLGEVRLDFARPSGDAQLTLWAVPVSTIYRLYGTAGILAALLVVLVLMRVWPRRRNGTLND